MAQLQQLTASYDVELELKAEYNQLRSEAAKRAKEIILRCAEILEQLSYPISGIASKLVEDLPYSRSYIYESLPEKYKRDYQKSASGQSEGTLESPLLVAIHAVSKTADLVKEACNQLLKKLIADHSKLVAVEERVSKTVIAELQETAEEVSRTIEEVLRLEDDRLIINELDKASIVMLSKTHSLRQIANHYYELKQRLHGPLPTKIVSKIVREGPLTQGNHVKRIVFTKDLAQGIVSKEDVSNELGEVLDTGRISDDEITLFLSTGLAIQDAVTADLVYRRAMNMKIGSHINLVTSSCNKGNFHR